MKTSSAKTAKLMNNKQKDTNSIVIKKKDMENKNLENEADLQDGKAQRIRRLEDQELNPILMRKKGMVGKKNKVDLHGTKANISRKLEDQDSNSVIIKKKKGKVGKEAATSEVNLQNNDMQGIEGLKDSKTQKVLELKKQAHSAINALMKYFSDRKEQSLFPDTDQTIGLTIVYKKPAMITKQLRSHICIITIDHCFSSLPKSHRTLSNSSVCLILPDIDRTKEGRCDPDVEKEARIWAEKIEKDHGVTRQHYSKILTKWQLQREYQTYFQKRALASSYDVFIVEGQVSKSVRTFLGKEFHKAHKIPSTFAYKTPLLRTINKALSYVTFPLCRYMTRASVSFGHLNQTSSDLAENVDAVIDHVLRMAPGGIDNIRSMFIQPKGAKPSLPVFIDEGLASDVKLEKPEKIRKELEQTVDECSTLPDGLKISVRRNGKIRVLKESDGLAVHFPTVNDEWEEGDDLKPTFDPKSLEKKKINKLRRASDKFIVEVIRYK
uniref:NARG2_C domain-containing protein n=1 Tax=Heterorhabditis bacteriophora TaxID=37862 RepID=A0A1I7XM66_HETBA